MAEDIANSIGEFLHAAVLSVAPWVFEVHWITWVLLSPVLFLAYAIFAGKRSNSKFKRLELPVEMNHEAFQQAGLRVCYKDATVSFPGGRTYPVTAVRSLRFENFLRPNQKKWFAYIEVEDMEQPVYTFAFSYGWVAEQFIPRVRMALEKAGALPFRTISSEHVESIDQHHIDPRKGSYTPTVVDAGTVIELQPIREC